MLLDNVQFTDDTDLQNMDKEDALICFQDHIKMLEQEFEEDRERDKKALRRTQRKNREAFLVFLDELHEVGKLHSMSLWMDLYAVICQDQRFTSLLGQPGSTPLDLFKFYVEDLKARFHDEKRVIKEILKGKNLTVEVDTSFEEFAGWLIHDKEAISLDAGNIKLTYNSLIEKAESREKERVKEEEKKQKRLESGFRAMLRQATPAIDETTRWDEVRPRIECDPAFRAVLLEADRLRLFKEYIGTLEETSSRSNRHSSRKHSKKSKKSRRRSQSRSASRSDSAGDTHGSKQKKKSRHSRSASKSLARSASPEHGGHDHKSTSQRHAKKSKRRRPSQSPTTKNRSPSSGGEDKTKSTKERDGVTGPKRRQGSSPAPQTMGHGRATEKKDKKSWNSSEESELSEGELENRRRALLAELEGSK